MTFNALLGCDGETVLFYIFHPKERSTLALDFLQTRKDFEISVVVPRSAMIVSNEAEETTNLTMSVRPPPKLYGAQHLARFIHILPRRYRLRDARPLLHGSQPLAE
jgi:hypothetical protein